MTVSVPAQLVYSSSGDGVTSQFAYPVRVLEAGELVVVLREDGVDTTQVLSTDYTLSGIGDEGGVTITFMQVPTAAQTVIRYRETAAKQIVDLEDRAKNSAEAVEKQLDRLAMVGQDHGRRISGLEDVAADLDEAVQDAADSAEAAAASEAAAGTSEANAAAAAQSSDEDATASAAAADRAEAAAAGVNMPAITIADAGKQATVKADGSGWEAGDAVPDDGVTTAKLANEAVTDAKVGTPATAADGISVAKLTYLGGSTGAVARLLSGRLHELPHITDLGASSANADNTQEFQDLIDYIYTNDVGGAIFVPSGNYKTNKLTLKGGVRLVGAARWGVTLTAVGDNEVIEIDATGLWAGFSHMTLSGYQNAAATKHCVKVGSNVKALIEHADIIGGNSAIFTLGVDGTYHDLNLQAFGSAGSCVLSQGANWYERCKMDNSGAAIHSSFYQGTFTLGSSSVAENTFSLCDFSGNFTYSIYVNDGADHNSITTINGGVVAAEVLFQNHKLAKFAGTHFGTEPITSNNGVIVMGGCAAFSPITVTAGTKSLGGCHNLS